MGSGFDFSRASLWPEAVRYAGIAHGWQGHAWVWLHLVLSGLAPCRPNTLRAIRRRLKASPRSTYSSHMVGSAATPLVAALASKLDGSLSAAAEGVVARWVASFPGKNTGDVMLGAAGALLAAAEIEAHLPGRLPSRFARTLHQRCEQGLVALLERRRERGAYLGFAHGLVGYLFSLETARKVFRVPVDGSVRAAVLRTLQETKITVPGSRAALWPALSSEATLTIHGWCHGGPGIGLGLAGCYALTGLDRYLGLARQALRGVSLCRNTNPSICCGALGQVQVLIEASRLEGRSGWLDLARRIYRRTPRASRVDRQLRRGLWKGTPGRHYTAWRLAHPRAIPFPGLGLLSATPGSR